MSGEISDTKRHQPIVLIGSNHLLNYAIQWVLLLMILGYAVYLLTKPDTIVPPDRSSWNNSKAFWSISYKGIVKNPDGINVTREKLISHLEALKKSGFETIDSLDLYNFYYKNTPLPSKPLYLIFENARKDTVVYAEPILRKLNYKASLYVIGHKIDSWNKFFLRKNSLVKLEKDVHWTVHSKGYKANELIKTGAAETDKGHYLTNRLWNEKNGGFESYDGFQERIKEDYENAFKQLSFIKNDTVMGYIYPFSDTGNQRGADPRSLNWNKTFIKKYFNFSFSAHNNPHNTNTTNPYNLKRLSVDPDIDSEYLLKELLSFQPKWGIYSYRLEEGDSGDFIHDWYSSEGRFNLSGKRLLFQPDKDKKRATFWLKGSKPVENVMMVFDLKNRRDIRWSFYLRYKDPSSYIKVNMDNDVITVLQKRGKNLVKTSEKRFLSGRNDRMMLKIMVKNNRLFAWVDDKNIFSSPEYIFPDIQAGLFGVSLLFDKNIGPIESPISNITFKSLPEIWLIDKDLNDIDRKYLTYANVFSPLFEDFIKEEKNLLGITRLNMLLKLYGVRLMPVVLLESLESVEFLEALFFNKNNFDGITVAAEGDLKKEDIENLRKDLMEIKKMGIEKVALLINYLTLSRLIEKPYTDIINGVESIILYSGKDKQIENSRKVLSQFSRQFNPEKLIITSDVDSLKSISVETFKSPSMKGTDFYEEKMLDHTIKILGEHKDNLNVFLNGLYFKIGE